MAETEPNSGNNGVNAQAVTVAVTVVVCTSCRGTDGADARPRPGERLAEAVKTLAPEGVSVHGVECLGNCKRRLSAAVVSPESWTYVFGELSEESGPDLILGAQLLRGTSDGIMPWRGRPDSLKRGLVARIPPLAKLEKA
ncbi:MAG: DUF1636 family protein [Methylobacterium mesophilicum]|nr:DUF1636 family protein [Methylobacterium mesophilicum]